MTSLPSQILRSDISFMERFISSDDATMSKSQEVIVIAPEVAEATSLHQFARRLFPDAAQKILSDGTVPHTVGPVQQHSLTADRENQLKTVRASRALATAVFIAGSCLIDFSRNEAEVTVQAIEAGGYLIVGTPESWRQVEQPGEPNERRILPPSSVIDQFIRALSRQGHVRSLSEFANFSVTDHFLVANRPVKTFSLGSYENVPKVAMPETLLSQPRDSISIIGESEVVPIVTPNFLGDGDLSPNPFRTTMVVPEMHVARLSNVLVCPRQILVREEALLPDSFRRYRPRDAHVCFLREGDTYRSLVATMPTRIIEEPVFYLDGEHAFHFGHFLLEVLPRAWPLLKGDFSGIRILVNYLKPFQQEILAALNISPEQILMISEPILARDIFIASQAYVLEQYGAPSAFELWSEIGSKLAASTGAEKIYISRSKYKDKRNLINETAIEDHLRERGYEILYPETMSFAEQVTAFRNAKRIVGTSGSAMYNCVFCKDHVRKLFIAPEKFVSVNDMIINTQKNGTLHYFLGHSLGEGSAMRTDWIIDLEQFYSAFDSWDAHSPQ